MPSQVSGSCLYNLCPVLHLAGLLGCNLGRLAAFDISSRVPGLCPVCRCLGREMKKASGSQAVLQTPSAQKPLPVPKCSHAKVG